MVVQAKEGKVIINAIGSPPIEMCDLTFLLPSIILQAKTERASPATLPPAFRSRLAPAFGAVVWRPFSIDPDGD